MNLKCLFFTLACFGAIAVLLAQNGTSHPDTESLCDVLRANFREHQASAEGYPIDVLFFDINRDGTPDALMAFREALSGGGCHGNYWSPYRFKDGKWQTVPSSGRNELNNEPNIVFARGDDFYSLAVDGQKPKLVLIYTRQGWTDKGKAYIDTACEITIDSEGYLTTIPIPELSGEYPCGDDGDEAPPDQEPRSPESLAMEKRLTPLSIESFLPQKDIRDRIAFLADREEAERQTVVVGDETLDAVDQANAQHETQDAADIPPPNRLWLYLVLPIGILCATAYFMREKSP